MASSSSSILLFIDRLIHIHFVHHHYSSPSYRDRLHLLSFSRHDDAFTDSPWLFFTTESVKQKQKRKQSMKTKHDCENQLF